MTIESAIFARGIEEFNQGEFYECHETLEEYWTGISPEISHREMVQGIIQIAVGLYHLGRGNVKGALKLLGRGHGRLQAYLPASHGLYLAECAAIVAADIALLESGCAFDDRRLKIPTIQNNWAA